MFVPQVPYFAFSRKWLSSLVTNTTRNTKKKPNTNHP